MGKIFSGQVHSGSISATTYVELPDFADAKWASVHIKHDASLVATFAVEFSNDEDAAEGSTTAGEWIPASGVSLTAAAGALGGTGTPLTNIGWKRARVAIGHTTTGVATILYHAQD